MKARGAVFPPKPTSGMSLRRRSLGKKKSGAQNSKPYVTPNLQCAEDGL